MNRRSAKYGKGIFQRCDATCPPQGKTCRLHMWSYYVELPNGPNGQRRQWIKSGFVTAKEAADARNHTIASDNAGMLPTNGKQTVEDWLTGWLDGKTGSESIRSTTAFAYGMHVEKYLIPYLGHLRLIDLRPRHVTDMLIAIRKEHDERRSKALKATQSSTPRLRSSTEPHHEGGRTRRGSRPSTSPCPGRSVRRQLTGSEQR